VATKVGGHRTINTMFFEERKLKFTKVRASSNTILIHHIYVHSVCSVCVEYFKGMYETNLQDF